MLKPEESPGSTSVLLVVRWTPYGQARLPRLRKTLSPGLKEHQVAYPPYAEQQRIVAILDEAFEGIATAKANGEKNLQNAREWAAAQLTAVLSAASVSGRSGTLETLVAPSCTLSYGIVQPGDEVPGGLPVVRPVDLGDKVVYAEGLKRIDPALARSYTRTTLEGGDLLLCVRGTTGSVAVAEPALAGANVTRGIVPIRFDPGTVSQALGYYLMRSQPVQAQIRAKTYGTALMQINIGDLRKIVVAFPPAEKQAALVEQLDAIQEAADQLIDVYGRKLAALDELKKSLLEQAFTGQLSARRLVPTSAVLPSQTSSQQFTAAIISLAHERHRRRQRDKTFGHVKQQKLLHLVEALAKVDLGRQPMKDAAGPNDFPHQLKAENWARQNGFYDVAQRDGGGYDFKRLSGFDKLLGDAPQVLGASLGPIESVIDLLIPMDSQEAELFATVHAAWNNLLIDGVELTDDAIVREARDTWHADKLKIPEAKFHQTIALIRSKGLVPDGSGKYVGGQAQLI